MVDCCLLQVGAHISGSVCDAAGLVESPRVSLGVSNRGVVCVGGGWVEERERERDEALTAA